MNDARRSRLTATTLTAGVLALLVGAFVLPACSSSNDASGPSCTNGLKDDGEEGLDCGGVCPTKCTGDACTSGAECGSGSCTGNACAAPAGKACGVGAPVPTCNDGEACELDKDCKSGFCDGAKCATPAADSHTDGKKNSGETGVDCGGSVKATAPCPDGQGCIDSADCVGTCAAGICGPIGPMDGKKNNGETDVDCGGPNAPKCAVDKTCEASTDCVDDYCPVATKKCTLPRYDDGVQNGSETDVDCGGNVAAAGFKKCAEDKSCLADTDCTGACKTFGAAKKCIDAPSCKPHFGGDTCGDVDPVKQESCCKSLLVNGYTDPVMPAGTTKVYVDKYEITAGRMRAFVDAMAALNGGVPKIKSYTAAHRPARWNAGWESALPDAMTGTMATFSTMSPTPAGNLVNPGQDQYLANKPTQSSWSVASGNWQIDIGLVRALNSPHFFPEYVTSGSWPAPDYAASHDLNCSNTAGSYGYSTYYFDTATIAAATGEANVLGKSFSQQVMDEKALNCTPFGLYAAFCAWDGGQLMTGEVFDHLAGGPVVIPASGGTAPYNYVTVPNEQPRMTPGKTLCGGAGAPNTLNTFSDGTQACYNVWFAPLPPGNDHSHDGSARIAPPGRVPADVVKVVATDEGWRDLKGNLVEAVLRPGETARFDYRGFGVSYGSIIHHRNQQTSPRMKGGSFGARCMRFK